jgi:hypothetical protein
VSKERRIDVLSTTTITKRVEDLDWSQIGRDLDERGYAVTPRILCQDECERLAGLFDEEKRFRATVDMRRVRFGSGVYRYFDYPLPGAVQELRETFYSPLSKVANEWARKLRVEKESPETLPEFLERCHEKGQTRPTPLILRYEEGDHNALHQDVYGEVGFPFQVLTVLSQREVDFKGGEFLLVTQRPRAQSIGEAINLDQGEMLIFPNKHRPVEGKRGHYRVNVRHGVSPLRSGERYALGVIFHDAE